MFHRSSDRLTYAATARCLCGAGLAYERGKDYWDCSAILTGSADRSVRHSDYFPFVFWEILSEHQPSARGATTRPETRPEIVPEGA